VEKFPHGRVMQNFEKIKNIFSDRFLFIRKKFFCHYILKLLLSWIVLDSVIRERIIVVIL
jgi:hypothetical protein